MQFRFYGHFKDFSCWIWEQNVIWSIFSVSLNIWKLKWKYWFLGQFHTHPLPGPLSEKLNFKFVINLKTDFSGVEKVKNWILTLNFTFSRQLGSLITSRHTVRSSWNFQKLMQVRYTSDLDISGCENFLSKGS